MKIFLVFASVILVTSGAPHSSASIGSPYSSIQQAVTAQFSSSTPASLRGSSSIQQPLYAVPASLLQQSSSSQQQQDYNSVDRLSDNSYSNPILNSYGIPQQQQQQQQQQPQQQLQQQSQIQQQIQQQISTNQPLSYNQYTTLLENGNPPLHSTPFHVSNDYNETPDSSNNNNNNNNNGGGGGDGKQTVVIHKHIHMHYFVRGAELPELPPAPEEKTFVYVLLKKPDGPPAIVFPQAVPPTKPSKPEVYFIQYKDSKNKQQQQQQQQQQSDKGQQQLQSGQGSIQNNNSNNPSSPVSSNNHNNIVDNINISPPPIPSSQYGARIAKSVSS